MSDTVCQLLYGDCLELMRDIPDRSIDLIATDCPYHIVSGGCTNKGDGNGIFRKENAGDGKLFAHNDISFSAWIPEAYRVLKPDTHFYVFCNGRNMMKLQQAAEAAGFTYQNTRVWDKGNVTPNRYYMNACEFVLLFRKGRARTINYTGTSNMLRVKNRVGKKSHPTEKPVDLMQIFIENSSAAGDLILDPFMGTGSTGIACMNTGRRFIGMELDLGYFEIAQKRIEESQKNRQEAGYE